MVESYIKKSKREMEDGLTLAWLNAGWQRSKKMPELEKILGTVKDEKKEPQKPKDMLDVIKMLNAKFGGETY